MFLSFSLVKLIFSNIFKCVAWLHMHDLFLARRVSALHECVYTTIKCLIRLLVLSLQIRVVWVQLCRLVHLILLHHSRLILRYVSIRLIMLVHSRISLLNSSILLALAWERDMLRYHIAISVSYRRTTSLISSSNAVIICEFMHCSNIFFCLLLLIDLFLLFFICNLLSEVSLVFEFPLLFLKYLLCSILTF